MRKYLLIFAVVGISFSCQEDIVLQEDIAEELDLSTYYSYTLDGVLYESEGQNGWGNGNPPANFEVIKAFSDYDSLFFHTMSKVGDPGNPQLEINIGKKFATKDLIQRFDVWFKLSPKDREEFLVEGNYPFAFDFTGKNSHNGVAMKIQEDVDGKRESLTTYSTVARGYESAVTPEAHSESSFVITKIHNNPNGGYIVEAEFDAKFFGNEIQTPTETIKRVKGKARFFVDFWE